ncbi:hypothetical protein DFQ27_002125 [Actinomortierella ambigua]|uniref:P-loop containing nucleoside triphosphate hydrolase protein n=1 Tax=Actinomortierella ambigua TaxID=1343610 RepID=A0A9P6Q858_9FUNG|nr:hypothetical protein DFQ27_002125 [Actinomortierella ambigua]
MQREMSIIEPSTLQREFIPPILHGQDILIRDTTGSGKTFGILLSLLSKPRVMIPVDLKKQLKGRRSAVRPGITSVFIVPNQELAFQLLDWTKQLLPDLIGDSDSHELDQHHNQLDALIQVLTVSSPAAHEAQITQLAKTLPHVLVATPSRLWTLLQQGVLDLSMIETLVLDEVDHLVRIPGRYATQQQLANRDAHPKPAELAVREILRSAKALGRCHSGDDTDKEDGESTGGEASNNEGLSKPNNTEVVAMKKEIQALEQVIASRRNSDSVATDGTQTVKKRAKSKTNILQTPIQLIASSATMNRTIRHWLLTNQWIFNPVWVDTTKSVVLPQGIQHYCLVVGQNSIRNMKKEADPYQAKDQLAVPKMVAQGKDEDEDEDDEDGGDRHLHRFENDDDDDNDDGDDDDEQQYRDWAATDQEWQDAERAWQQQQLEKADTGHQHIATVSQSFSDDDDRMLESVVNACALENASTACVFFCNQPSLPKISDRLEHQFEFPVKLIQDAYQQDQQSLTSTSRKGLATPASAPTTKHPSVFIANESNARGLDLPNISHVIVVGLPSCPSSYLHMAGRTGRFGKMGKVVTILRDEGRIEDRARTLFKTLQVNIEPFPHVE